MQRKFVEVENLLESGKTYIDVGWPIYAWLPYLSSRFGENLSFMHLVRNPFRVAASLTTHGLFVPGNRGGRKFENRAMVHPEDRTVYYKSVVQNARSLSGYERNLFHWLELNQFALDLHGLKGFAGLARFEELYGDDDSKLPSFLKSLCGEAEYDLSSGSVSV